jgi:hypothetical protein
MTSSMLPEYLQMTHEDVKNPVTGSAATKMIKLFRQKPVKKCSRKTLNPARFRNTKKYSLKPLKLVTFSLFHKNFTFSFNDMLTTFATDDFRLKSPALLYHQSWENPQGTSRSFPAYNLRKKPTICKPDNNKHSQKFIVKHRTSAVHCKQSASNEMSTVGIFLSPVVACDFKKGCKDKKKEGKSETVKNVG